MISEYIKIIWIQILKYRYKTFKFLHEIRYFKWFFFWYFEGRWTVEVIDKISSFIDTTDKISIRSVFLNHIVFFHDNDPSMIFFVVIYIEDISDFNESNSSSKLKMILSLYIALIWSWYTELFLDI